MPQKGKNKYVMGLWELPVTLSINSENFHRKLSHQKPPENKFFWVVHILFVEILKMEISF